MAELLDFADSVDLADSVDFADSIDLTDSTIRQIHQIYGERIKNE